jgi:hypothetical protein
LALEIYGNVSLGLLTLMQVSKAAAEVDILTLLEQ